MVARSAKTVEAGAERGRYVLEGHAADWPTISIFHQVGATRLLRSTGSELRHANDPTQQCYQRFSGKEFPTCRLSIRHVCALGTAGSKELENGHRCNTVVTHLRPGREVGRSLWWMALGHRATWAPASKQRRATRRSRWR
jgi:hypothetical protein